MTPRRSPRRRAAARAGPASLAALLLAGLVASACAAPSRWHSHADPSPELVRLLLEADRSAPLAVLYGPAEVPAVPVRERLRPCCAFGGELRVKVAGIPVPGLRIPNVIERGDLGPHTYDSGVLQVVREGTPRLALNREHNGILYTCRGGFVDSAHVRDYVDWASYFAVAVARVAFAGEPGEIGLPDEGGRRRVLVSRPPAVFVEQPITHVIAAGQWLAWQLSIWHEVATWYGWSSVPGFPETASSFSPEDLYSNLLGVKIAGAVLERRAVRDEALYDDSVAGWMDAALELLDAVPRDVAADAVEAVDGRWWDSAASVPDRDLVLRRAFDVEGSLEPWLVPPERAPASLEAACADARPPLVLAPRDEFADVPFADWLTLEIRVTGEVAQEAPFARPDRWVTQADFPAIVAAIREQNRRLFGPSADRP